MRMFLFELWADSPAGTDAAEAASEEASAGTFSACSAEGPPIAKTIFSLRPYPPSDEHAPPPVPPIAVLLLGGDSPSPLGWSPWLL